MDPDGEVGILLFQEVSWLIPGQPLLFNHDVSVLFSAFRSVLVFFILYMERKEAAYVFHGRFRRPLSYPSDLGASICLPESNGRLLHRYGPAARRDVLSVRLAE